MDLRVLGPVEVTDGATTVPIGGPRQRLVLALLILRVGETVSTDRLIDDVWGDDSPDAARRTVQAYVSNLRKTLEAIRPGTLIARSPGYVLAVDDGAIDARRFEQSLTLGTRLLKTSPAQAASVLGEGLALWRGAPYADLAGSPALRTEITRLEELRTNAIETRIAADLALGRHGRLIGELETLVAEHPFNERFACQLMVALYRSGRQADALRVAQRTRTALCEELGIDPSPDLQDLERSILEQDPSLEFEMPAHQSDPDDARPDVIRGFEIRQRIGGSHWAETYVAYQRSLEREVVIRIINPLFSSDDEFMERFYTSIARMIRVAHPNIVPFYDTWRDSDAAYIVRRYFPRGSLQDVLADGTWDPADTPRIVSQIGSALGAIHRHGMVHADVKASDILLDEDSNAYITDFALPASVFGSAESFLAHRRADGSPLTDEELLAEPTPQLDIRGLARVARRMLEGCDVSPAAATVLDTALSADTTDQYGSIDEFVEAFLDASGDVTPSTPPISHNPYKGLRAFTEADRCDFFGREDTVSALTARLANPASRCVALVGASGTGKSSVLNAGLVPSLRDGAIAGSDQWTIVKMHPGAHPYGELASALQQASLHPNRKMLGHLTWGDADIAEVIISSTSHRTGETLLIVDQFEELFTLVRDESVRASFIDDLVSAAVDPDVHLRLILSLRADFYDRPLEYPRLADQLTGCTVTMVPITGDALVRAISEPAIGVGAEFDPGLAGRIAADVEGQPGMLPLVQYAMTHLFERREGSRITTAAYEASGGVQGPLRTRPEAIYRDLSSDGQNAARQVFLHLVALGDDGRGSRRRVARSELTSMVGYEHAANLVIDAFGEARLLSFDRHPVTRSPTVEIAHDALLREWSRLRGWIDDHRSDVRLHQRLADATADWVSSNRDPDFLLTGGLLERLSGWSKSADLALSDIEQSYLDASVALSVEEAREEIERLHHEEILEDKSRRRLRMLAIVWTLTALIAVLGVFAFAKWQHSENLAEQAAAIDEADNLANLSHFARAADPEFALLIALRAVETTIDAGAPVTDLSYNALTQAVRALDIRSPDGEKENAFGIDLSRIILIARSNLTRGFTQQECVQYLGLETCPIDTIASPLDQ